MSLSSIQDHVAEINETTSTVSGHTDRLVARANDLITKADPLLDQLGQIETRIKHIESWLIALIAVIGTVVIVEFIYWFVMKVVPLLKHKHKHTFDQLVSEIRRAA